VARYSVTNAKAGVNTANTIMWMLRAVTNRAYLLELSLSVTVAPTTGPDFLVSRSATAGTSSATVTPQQEGSLAPASSLLLDTAWSANPTLAATPLRGQAVPNAIGSGQVWTWYDKPLEIEPAATGHIIISNVNATGATLGSMRLSAVLDI
jgi:hypothetical protein